MVAFLFADIPTVTNIFIRNLDLGASEDQLRAAFAGFGEVGAITIVVDRDTGQPRGFAFVEMPDSRQAETAILSLDGTVMNQRQVTVNEARVREDVPGHKSDRGRDHRRHRI